MLRDKLNQQQMMIKQHRKRQHELTKKINQLKLLIAQNHFEHFNLAKEILLLQEMLHIENKFLRRLRDLIIF